MPNRNVYGFCDAGCKYPVLKKDEFDNYLYENQNAVKFVDGGLKTASGEFVELGQSSIVRGSYVGTGTYGANNPNTLTFERPLKMLIIMPAIVEGYSHTFYQPDDGDEYYDGAIAPSRYGNGGTPVFLFGTEFKPIVSNASASESYDDWLEITQWGASVSWYCSANAKFQRNASNCTYHYVAFLG